MRLSTIQNHLLKYFKKKKQGNAYLQPALHSCSIPGESRRRPGENKGTEIVRDWVVARRRKKIDVYSRPVPRKSLFARIAGFVFLLGALSMIAFVGGVKIQNSLESLTFFNVSGIVVSGNKIVSKECLQEESGIILHQTSLLSLDRMQIEKRLADLPWINHAVVKRNWPSTIEISIKENVPVGLLLSNDSSGPGLHYIDKKGHPFLAVKPGADIDYPVITGLSEVTDQTVRAKAQNDVLAFLKAIRSNDPHLPSQSVSEIHVDQNGEMVVYLVEYTFPIFFGNGNTKQKYSRLVYVLKDLYKKNRGKELISRVEFIQMKYLDDNVLVARSGSG